MSTWYPKHRGGRIPRKLKKRLGWRFHLCWSKQAQAVLRATAEAVFGEPSPIIDEAWRWSDIATLGARKDQPILWFQLGSVKP